MAIQCGIVGLPNVGKSTLFNALTKAAIPAENYPFCTIEPNVGVVAVPDARLVALVEIAKPQKTLPAVVEFVDIAGLVAGASKGEGLGNKFLSHIRETDAIAQVVRCFENDDVVHVAGKVDPLGDIEVINTELALADLETVSRALDRLTKVAKSGDKQARARIELLEPLREALNEARPARTLEFTDDARKQLREYNLITLKPLMYIANVSEAGFTNNPLLDQLHQHADAEGAQVVPVCASIEAELALLEPEEQGEFLADLGLEEPGLNRVIRAGYELLGLQTYFTAGEKEVRAWTVRKGASAPQAAGVIHSDFEHGFIRAEVIAYHDYVACKGEAGAREVGKWRLEGKDYIVHDGDVMHFRFNT